MIDRMQFKSALIRAAIVLLPSYSAAYITDKMVFVVPTLVAAGFFATSINLQDVQTSRRVDEDGETDGESEDDATQQDADG